MRPTDIEKNFCIQLAFLNENDYHLIMHISEHPFKIIQRRTASQTLANGSSSKGNQLSCSSIALQSQSLLQGNKTVRIVHHDQVYVLQATRQGKLILTK